MSLTPLGHRVLIRPDVQDDRTASGIILPENRDVLPASGSVVALGPGGAKIRYDARQRAIEACLRAFLNTEPEPSVMAIVGAAIRHLRGTADPVRDIAIGDHVAFPLECGLAVSHEGEEYLLVDEDDLVVLVTEEPHAA